MNRLSASLLAACIAMAIGASPALAQQGGDMGKDDQGQGMMGQGGMMNQGGQSRGDQSKGMMSQGMMSSGMMGSKKGDGCPMGKGMMGQGMMHSRPMMEAHLAYIKTDLEITDDQEGAWNTYAEAVRSSHDIMEKVMADMMKAKESGTALERMDARISATEAKLEGIKALKPAVEGLYAVLTDAQKQKADKLLGAGCGMM
jgi:LTXXQ motif family protein